MRNWRALSRRRTSTPTRLERRALQQRRAAVAGSLGGTEALLARATGVVSAVNVVNGQVVEARETLLEIVDPARLGVEALAYDPALVTASKRQRAFASGGTLELQFVGGGRQLREQALPLLFRVNRKTHPWQWAKRSRSLPQTSRTAPGRGGAAGRAGAQQHRRQRWSGCTSSAERFAQRRVSAQPWTPAAVALTTGVTGGERVVTEGANLLAQIR